MSAQDNAPSYEDLPDASCVRQLAELLAESLARRWLTALRDPMVRQETDPVAIQPQAPAPSPRVDAVLHTTRSKINSAPDQCGARFRDNPE